MKTPRIYKKKSKFSWTLYSVRCMDKGVHIHYKICHNCISEFAYVVEQI